jgi:hypothetical protein
LTVIQYQFCHARNAKDEFCTQLIALPDDVTSQTFPDANGLQLALLKLLVESSYIFDMSNTGDLTFRDTSQSWLRSGSYTGSTVPDDQWIQELKTWEASTWVAIQTAVSDYAIGPLRRINNQTGGINGLPPQTEGEKQLCQVMKMKKNGAIV